MKTSILELLQNYDLIYRNSSSLCSMDNFSTNTIFNDTYTSDNVTVPYFVEKPISSK